MRYIAPESGSPLPRTTGGGVPVARRSPIAARYAFALACVGVAPFLGLDSRAVDPRICEVWPPGVAGFVLLTVIWRSGRRAVLMTLAWITASFAVTAMLMHQPVGTSTWWALAATAQAVLMVAVYRRGISHDGWAPETPRDVAVLAAAAAGSSLAVALIGGFPSLPAGEVSPLLLWWVLRSTVFCFVGAATFLVIFYRHEIEALATSSWPNRIALLIGSALCVWGTYHAPSLPLSWLLIIPSLWGGLTLTLRGTAYLALTVAVLAAAMTYVPMNQFGYDRLLPAASIVDLLLTASTALMLLLALMREQRARLLDELDSRGRQSETQRQLLAAVFDSMHDGVIIFDGENVSMYNSSARKMLGRRIPQGPPESWMQTFGATFPDGSPIDDDQLSDLLYAPDGTAVTGHVELLLTRNGGTRVVDVTAQPLARDSARTTMLLLSDVTAHRARVQELTSFAGRVAHDLRGPLTVLDGWLEMLQDTRDSLDPANLDDAIVRARESSKRMNQVIEDWLAYTVLQDGRLQFVPVRLDVLATEIVESHVARWDEDQQPCFELDLPHLVEADPGMLRQLIDNLVGNAVKYTPADQAPIVRIASTNDCEEGWVSVEVTDNGVGIPEGEEELIFEEFHRGPDVGRTTGTGLGLALTRRIVALHGGELTATRNPGGGSSFTFTLPGA